MTESNSNILVDERSAFSEADAFSVLEDSGIGADAQGTQEIRGIKNTEFSYRPESQLVRLNPGIDVFIVRKEIFSEEVQATDWQEGGTTQDTSFNYGLYSLRGMLEQRERTLTSPDGYAYNLMVQTAPYRYNQVMERLGRHPGIDSYKLVDSSGGRFSSTEYASSATRLEIPISSDDINLATHDRDLSDHIPVWWSTPADKARMIAAKAEEALISASEHNWDEDLNNFTEGLDLLAQFPRPIIEFVTDLVDGMPELSVGEKVKRLQDFLYEFADPLAPVGFNALSSDYPFDSEYTKRNLAAYALMKMGFLPILRTDKLQRPRWPRNGLDFDPKSPELLHAKAVLTEWAKDYTINILDVWSRLDEIVGVPEGKDSDARDHLFAELNKSLDEIPFDGALAV